MFQGGDVSLAVTFVAAGEARGAWSVEHKAVTDPPTPTEADFAKARAASIVAKAMADKSAGQVGGQA